MMLDPLFLILSSYLLVGLLDHRTMGQNQIVLTFRFVSVKGYGKYMRIALAILPIQECKTDTGRSKIINFVRYL